MLTIRNTFASVVIALAFAASLCSAQEAPAPTPPPNIAPAPEVAPVPAPAPAVEAQAEAPATAPVAAPTTPPPAPTKFAVILPERIEQNWFWFYYTDEIEHVVQSLVEKALIAEGLDVVDVSGSSAFAGSTDIAQLTSKEAAVAKAKQLGATHVIVGTAIADKASEDVAYGITVIRANADISAKLVRVSDGKVLAVETASGKAGGQAIRATGREALAKAGDSIADKLARDAKAAAAAP